VEGVAGAAADDLPEPQAFEVHFRSSNEGVQVMKHHAGLYAVVAAALLLIPVERSFAVERLPAGLPPSAALLLRYDANHDGVVTREEMEAGLKADFDAADSNHDGCLDATEVRVENESRLARDGAQASPLVDWNLDGCVDMKEFGNTVRSYFQLVDKKKDGRVTLLELRGPSMPIAPRTVEARKKPGDTGTTSTNSTASAPSTTSAPSATPGGARY
jgi:EF hand